MVGPEGAVVVPAPLALPQPRHFDTPPLPDEEEPFVKEKTTWHLQAAPVSSAATLQPQGWTALCCEKGLCEGEGVRYKGEGSNYPQKATPPKDSGFLWCGERGGRGGNPP